MYTKPDGPEKSVRVYILNLVRKQPDVVVSSTNCKYYSESQNTHAN
jgi:hypothetical protein